MNKSLRDVLGEQLVYLGKKYKNLICVSPDLKQATKLDLFFKKYPERSIECGIAEANAIGISSGLALSGFKVVVASFGSFISGKNIEIRNSIAQNNSKVVIVGTHGGLIGPDGPSQAGLQDISVMRSIPNFSIFQPSTPYETVSILDYVFKNDVAPCYIRISREGRGELHKSIPIFDNGKLFKIIKNYENCCIVSSGPIALNAYKARKSLDIKGIGLVTIPSIKPINLKQLKNLALNTKLIITIEDHNIMGGIGSAINEAVLKLNLKSIPRIINHGINDIFTQSDNVENLYKNYRLDVESIKSLILKNIK